MQAMRGGRIDRTFVRGVPMPYRSLPPALGILLAIVTVAAVREVLTVSPSEAANHIGQEVVVEGVISDVGYSARSDTTFLNMGGKYPNHTFTAVIFKSAKSLFPEARSWEGKKMSIRGVVKEYRGEPAIVLERVEQVTVVR